jgi:muramoyltetrapeptide carboxypeptidase
MTALKRAERVFAKYDMQLSWGKNITRLRSDCWHSADVESRVHELEEAFRDPETSCVWAAEGGYSAVDLVPHLDYDVIRASGKAFVGMSDITALNNALLARAQFSNFSGMNIRCRDENAEDDMRALELSIELLMVDGPWYGRPFEESKFDPRCVCPGIAEGWAVGGNLTIFTGLIGTPYLPDCTGAILFFEDTHAGGYEVSTNITRLELSGILSRAKGVVFGEFAKKVERGDQDMCIEDVIYRKFNNVMPCIYGMNFSHGKTCAVIPLGCKAVMDADNRSVSFGNPFAE